MFSLHSNHSFPSSLVLRKVFIDIASWLPVSCQVAAGVDTDTVRVCVCVWGGGGGGGGAILKT